MLGTVRLNPAVSIRLGPAQQWASILHGLVGPVQRARCGNPAWPKRSFEEPSCLHDRQSSSYAPWPAETGRASATRFEQADARGANRGLPGSSSRRSGSSNRRRRRCGATRTVRRSVGRGIGRAADAARTKRNASYLCLVQRRTRPRGLLVKVTLPATLRSRIPGMGPLAAQFCPTASVGRLASMVFEPHAEGGPGS